MDSRILRRKYGSTNGNRTSRKIVICHGGGNNDVPMGYMGRFAWDQMQLLLSDLNSDIQFTFDFQVTQIQFKLA